MTAPVTPVAQALAWSGGDLPDVAAQPVAAIGNGLLLAYDGSVLSLWRLVGIPQRIAALVVGESLSTFRHTSGTVRCIASSGGVDRLAAIGIGGSGITYSLGSSALPPTIVEMIVAEGGQETVISTSDSIIGYTAAGTWSWECARPDAADPNTSGKLVGAPRAGRWLWVNTTSESRVENHTGVLGTPSGDATSGYTWSVTFPTLDVTGETVLHASARADLEWGGTIGSFTLSGGIITVGGVTFSSDIETDLGASFGDINGDLPGASTTLAVSIVDDSAIANWMLTDLIQFLEIDQTALGGGHIELYSSSGTRLSRAAAFTTAHWVGTGVDRSCYVDAFVGDVYVAEVTSYGDVLEVLTEHEVVTDYSTADVLLDAFDGQLVIAPVPTGGGDA